MSDLSKAVNEITELSCDINRLKKRIAELETFIELQAKRMVKLIKDGDAEKDGNSYRVDGHTYCLTCGSCIAEGDADD